MAMQQKFSLNENDHLLAVTTFAFDISALEIYLPLISGASLTIAQRRHTRAISINDTFTRRKSDRYAGYTDALAGVSN